MNIKSTSEIFIKPYYSAEIQIKYYRMATSQPLIQKSTIIFNSPTRQALLHLPVQSLIQASYSTVLTLASFIMYHYPSLLPPNNSQISVEGNTIDNLYPQIHLTYNRLYEPWCDYLASLFLDNKVSQSGNICFFNDCVSEDFINQLSSGLFLIQQKPQPSNQKPTADKKPLTHLRAQQSSVTPIQAPNKIKKIGIINFATSQLRTDMIRPKMHLVGLFAGIFFNQGDHWKLFNVLKQQYPSVQDYMELDTVILSGSSLSVNDQTPEFIAFIQTLQEAIKYNPKLKILGTCFGHQALAKMFGGKIVQKQLLTGVQIIDFDENLIHKVPYFRRTELGHSTFELSEYHKDFVVQVPQNFEIFAQSQTCTIESLISKDMKYLSFQFHPEYSAEYIRSFQMRLQHYQIFDLRSSYSHTEIGSIKHESSLWEIRKIIRNFLDWEVEAQ